jgi:hypothetical protein
LAIQTPTTAPTPRTNDLRQSGWSPPSQANLTFACFFKATAGTSTFRAVAHLHDGGTELVFNVDDSNKWSVFEGGLKAVSAATVSLNVWYFGAFTAGATGTSDLIGYLGRVDTPGTALAATAAATRGGVNAAPTNFDFLNDGYDEPWLGAVESVKIWSGAVLTAAELEQERRSLYPVRRANLFAWYRWNNLADRLVDYSGNGRVLAQLNAGTHNTVTADGPGVRLRRSRRISLKAAAAASGVTGTAAPTLASATSAAAGNQIHKGASAPTLASATGSAAGTTAVVGSSAQTLAGATSSASGSVGSTTSGTVAVTLASATSGRRAIRYTRGVWPRPSPPQPRLRAGTRFTRAPWASPPPAPHRPPAAPPPSRARHPLAPPPPPCLGRARRSFRELPPLCWQVRPSRLPAGSGWLSSPRTWPRCC